MKKSSCLQLHDVLIASIRGCYCRVIPILAYRQGDNCSVMPKLGRGTIYSCTLCINQQDL